MDKPTERQVRVRARGRCKYCLIPESFSKLKFAIDHVIARQHGGAEVLDNLALACGFCNRHKGPIVAGVDPDTGAVTRLFHPRLDPWAEQFAWDGPTLKAKTAIGRVTIVVLAINHSYQVAVRHALMAEGAFSRD